MKSDTLTGLALTAFLMGGISAGQGKNIDELKERLVQRFGEERVTSIFSDPRFRIDMSVPKIRAAAKEIDYIDRGDCSDAAIEMGVGFFEKHNDSLLKAQKKYGVDAEYITALLYLESKFGINKGRKPVINAYASNWLYAKTEKREQLFHGELEKLLEMKGVLYADDDSIFDLKGSYAGAFGWPQAITSSYHRFGVDFDGDGDIDVMDPNDPDDSIGFVAKYLEGHGFSENKFEAV